ncbi:MAG TPA: hypothetical protein VK718_05530 [Ferruginibacter sp.]|jgi:hypothetical protein|nr:hypothetical protein [Ferruginibacter sp.]
MKTIALLAIIFLSFVNNSFGQKITPAFLAGTWLAKNDTSKQLIPLVSSYIQSIEFSTNKKALLIFSKDKKEKADSSTVQYSIDSSGVSALIRFNGITDMVFTQYLLVKVVDDNTIATQKVNRNQYRRRLKGQPDSNFVKCAQLDTSTIIGLYVRKKRTIHTQR